MKCPKCDQESLSDQECSFCGVIFSKIQPVSEPRIGEIRFTDHEPSRPGVWMAAVVLIISVAVTAWMVMDHKDSDKIPTVKAVNAPDHIMDDDSVQARLNAYGTPKNKIEKASYATVFVKTKWGSTGSGFFIDDMGHVVTNSHVVKISPEMVMGLRLQAEELKFTIENRRRQLDRMRDELPNVRDEAKRYDWEDRINHDETLMLEAEEEYYELMRRADEAGDPSANDVSIFLVDGSEITVTDMQVSNTIDLAVLTLAVDSSPFITEGRPGALAQGDVLYTIGNPEGMSFSVTRGIFSGWRNLDGTKYIQTDAPINPGNSGGPLVTKDGRVVGINTAKLKTAESIGFALPITEVKRLFSDILGH